MDLSGEMSVYYQLVRCFSIVALFAATGNDWNSLITTFSSLVRCCLAVCRSEKKDLRSSGEI